MDLTQLLPEDVLADVLGRVAPRSLAACRAACKSLRSIIDTHQLLRADLLPLKVGGIFMNFYLHDLKEFFSRPTTGPAISGSFDYMPPSWGHFVSDRHTIVARHSIQDHCNGLLLLENCVVNPATRQWDSLPWCPVLFKGRDEDLAYEEYLVFDPTVSPHYEVFMIPRVRHKIRRQGSQYLPEELDPMVAGPEWPPSVFVLHVFSSRSGCWEERSFVREGDAAGSIDDMRQQDCRWYRKRYAVHWRGALYVHYQNDFIMRISLSEDTYKVIKPPTHNEVSVDLVFHLGRSKDGVYIASVGIDLRLLVWVLVESHGNTSWVLKHNNCLRSILGYKDYSRPVLGPWVLQDINFCKYSGDYKELDELDGDMEYIKQKKLDLNCNKEELVGEKYEWDFEDDNILDGEDMVSSGFQGCMDILGFHPYKEIMFLSVSCYRALAYHLKDSKVQDLGYLYPTRYYDFMIEQNITESFPYTPCWIGYQKAKKQCRKTCWKHIKINGLLMFEICASPFESSLDVSF